MEDALGTRIATSAVPGGMGFNRVPSSTPSAEVTWDEMGQLGLHKALNEYYKLSASQRRLRLCGGADGGPPSAVCQLVRTFVCPQLPAALAPPALLAAGGALLYAAAWLLYSTAPLTIPLALWLAFAANGQLGLAPQAAAIAARLHPAAGAAAARLADVALPAPLRDAAQRPAAALALLAGLLLLRLAERAVLRRRQQRWEAANRRLAAADVQARYAGWAAPSGASPASPDAGAAAAQPAQQRKASSVPAPPLLQVLQEQVEALWHAVYGADALPKDPLETYEDIAAAVGHLSQETGVEALAPRTNGDAGQALLTSIVHIKRALGVA